MNCVMSQEGAGEEGERWRRDYNEFRPHSALTYLTPAEFALKTGSEASVNSKSDRFYKVRDLLNSAGDKYPSVPCKRMLLNQ